MSRMAFVFHRLFSLFPPSPITILTLAIEKTCATSEVQSYTTQEFESLGEIYLVRVSAEDDVSTCH